MGKATEEFVATIRSTGRGSDHYGTCDQCGKSCSEHFVRDVRRVYVREDGTRYLSGGSGGAYGHKECLIRHFGQAVDTATLVRDGNVYLAPAPAVV